MLRDPFVWALETGTGVRAAPRLLMVAPRSPLPSDHGASIRRWNLYLSLAEVGSGDVYLYDESRDDLTDLLREFDRWASAGDPAHSPQAVTASATHGGSWVRGRPGPTTSSITPRRSERSANGLSTTTSRSSKPWKPMDRTRHSSATSSSTWATFPRQRSDENSTSQGLSWARVVGCHPPRVDSSGLRSTFGDSLGSSAASSTTTPSR